VNHYDSGIGVLQSQMPGYVVISCPDRNRWVDEADIRDS
jgi:hypothetical protein